MQCITRGMKHCSDNDNALCLDCAIRLLILKRRDSLCYRSFFYVTSFCHKEIRAFKG